MESKENNTRVSFLTKLSALRGESCTKDWSPTGVMRVGNGPAMKYISVSQMKANLAPLFSKYKLEFRVNMMKPEFLGTIMTNSGNTQQHWMCGLNIVIEDTESDECEEYTFYGEGTDSLDKAIAKATSYALKTMLATVFLIADGMDPESDTGMNDIKSSFVPKTESQKQELRAQIASKAVKPAEEVPAPKAEKTETPAEVKEKAPFKLPSIHQNAIDHIVFEAKRKLEAGEITQSQYDILETASKCFTCIEDAKTFIRNNRPKV